MNKNLRVSIVIPVYNEEDTLAACLEAIAVQTVAPFEVIVVDNNSTDNTVQIAQRYPFVTLLSETHQGVVYARNRGFDAATGDIIGRIDADTLIPSNWTNTLNDLFVDPNLDALSGSMRYKDIAWSRLITHIDLAFRRYFAWQLGREVALQGANMALRRSAWNKVRGHVCLKGGLHEDFDLAIHLNKIGQRVHFKEKLVATVCNRRIESSLPDFYTYAMLSPLTYKKHGIDSGRYMYTAVIFALCSFWLMKILYRGYDPQSESFSWQQLFMTSSGEARVNPATFVD